MKMNVPSKATPKAPPRPRGRPRAFDEAQVLEAILVTFWTKGYSATSLDDLSAAAGVARPGLYAAFGDKHAMYRRALQAFQGRLDTGLATCFPDARPLPVNLRQFFHMAIDIYTQGGGKPLGCFAVCTASSEAHEDDDIRQDLQNMLRAMDQGLAVQFEKAQAQGAIDAHANPKALGRLAAGIVHSLAVRARAGERRSALKAMADSGVELLTRQH